MFGFGFLEMPRPFNTQYRCYSVSMLPGQARLDVEKGGKIIMPPSALDQLTRLNIVYPMLFKLTNPRAGQITHCGVLEFVADEGKIYLPYWMMQNLLLDEGDLLNIESASLPVATYSKFQAQSKDFLDISNQKAVLENALRNFACLTSGDVVAITYNEKVYELRVLETKPGNAVSIIECDMNVEFATPIGYSEPTSTVKKAQEENMDTLDPASFMPEVQGFIAFAGQGVRLDGKIRKVINDEPQMVKAVYQRGVPDLDYQIGNLRFIRAPKKDDEKDKEILESTFEAFSGAGQSLRQKKNIN